MRTLSRELRRLLENTVTQARAIAEEGARKALGDQYAVPEARAWPHMTPEACQLRNQLRAHGRQLGDRRDPKRETQGIEHLVQACAYEHWHRMLFARFLAENDLLLDPDHRVAMTLDEVRELAREQGRDWLDLAADLAQRMLLAVFRPDDPVLKVTLPPESRQKLEEKLAALPAEIFRADDSLGWVYQFWQRDEKDRINKSEVKIGANELPAVTELFTEDYIVLFLLENTLGAWWVAKRRAEGKDPTLPGYAWTYLRLNEQGSAATGSFDGWPRAARELHVLDPCMGSGHFLVFALPIFARMRMEEEGLSLEEALARVLRENLFGLEIDPRCSQIAAFNLALTAWRLAGEHFPLPEMNLACSGLGINASEDDWVKLAGRDSRAQETMRRLYALFKDAPTLGSLIDPLRFKADLYTAAADRVLPLLEEALKRENLTDEAHELAVAAQGVLAAFRILTSQFTLVSTNVPYLGRGKQDPKLAEYCAEFHPDAKADLATCFVDRCLRFCGDGGSVALVTPQNWLFLTSYKRLRERLLKGAQWDFVARLGEHAFDSPAAAGAFVALLGLTRCAPAQEHTFAGWDVSEPKITDEKARGLRHGDAALNRQAEQLRNPSAVISTTELARGTRLADYAASVEGLSTGDADRFVLTFWELPRVGGDWVAFQRSPQDEAGDFGRDSVLRWAGGTGDLANSDAARVQGFQAWGRLGVVVGQMRILLCGLSLGQPHDKITAVLVPKDNGLLPAILAYCQSKQYNDDVRRLTPKLNAATGALVQVPFDLGHWQRVAAEKYPCGLPKPHSDDPTQWLFSGHPKGSDHPLQVAVARLLGYRWPRQTGSSFPDCPALGPDGLEKHADSDGIVCLNPIAGQRASAADRLRALLADAYGEEWSAAKLKDLLGECELLEVWLRDHFFEDHCRIFHQRPFVWHIWDGRPDGFHALVNYHKLAAPNDEGRKTLEKLIYTLLGDWITRQKAEVAAGVDGADARLTAAIHLKGELEKILEGEKPYDIFVRWKPVYEQPIGWEPDINDGVRLNIRPWLKAKPYRPSRKDACILSVTPRIKYGKDRGKESSRPKEDFPWFWSWDGKSDDFKAGSKFDGARWNDLHYPLETKRPARKRKQAAEVKR